MGPREETGGLPPPREVQLSQGGGLGPCAMELGWHQCPLVAGGPWGDPGLGGTVGGFGPPESEQRPRGTPSFTPPLPPCSRGPAHGRC